MKKNHTNTPERRTIAWRRVGYRLVAMILLIVFLAAECATLISVE